MHSVAPADPSGAVAVGAGPFRSLRVRNFRLYFLGQGMSMCGTWIQRVAQDWLVLSLTHSGTALGLVMASQFAPILVLSPFGGLVVDRVNRRHLVLCTQMMLATLALVLGLLTLTGTVRLWMVFLLAGALGLVTAVDTPGRQSLLMELVGPEGLRNAASLNAVQVSAANAVGPAVAGGLIAAVSLAGCFLVNAATFGAVICSLLRMNPAALHRTPPVERGPGQVREGLRYVAGTRTLLVPLLMIAVIAALSYEFPVVLPVLATRTFHGGAEIYGLMTAAVGVGAVTAGIVIARGTGVAPLALTGGAVAFGVALALAAAAPTLALEFIALLVLGAAMMCFFTLANSSLQLGSEPVKRGRVMALWAMAYMGTIPLGAPIVGLVTQHAGPRWGLLLGAAVAVLTGLLGGASLLSRRQSTYTRARV